MAASYVVRAGHAFDGERFPPGGAQVHVDGGRIVAVRPADAPVPDGWQVFGGVDATVLSGPIDSHVHLVAGGEPNALALDAGRSAAQREQVIRRSLVAQVGAGVTTVRDLGDNRFVVVRRTVRDDELLLDLPFPARSPLEDVHYSFYLGSRNLAMVPVPSLDRAEVPGTAGAQIDQAARWFYGPARALRYLRAGITARGS